MDSSESENEKLFDEFLQQYLVQKGLHKTAEVFKQEVQLSYSSPHDNWFGGAREFVRTWWSVLHSLYTTPQTTHQESQAESSAQAISRLAAEQNVNAQTVPPNEEDSVYVEDERPVNSSSSKHFKLIDFSGHNQSIDFQFKEYGRLCTSGSKVVNLHFSRDGKFCASCCEQLKVEIWDIERCTFLFTPDGFGQNVTDIRFQPDSHSLAMSTKEGQVQLCDVDDPWKPRFEFIGHEAEVLSLDFHPVKKDMLCSCDGHGKIKLWNVNDQTCTGTFKGAKTKVRYQPLSGTLIATSTGNNLRLINAETGRLVRPLMNNEAISSFCWNKDGSQIVSISTKGVRVWSTDNGKYFIVRSENAEMFHTCMFHPIYSQIVILVNDKFLELWNITNDRSWTVRAHDGFISSLADSVTTNMVASASLDGCVKLWTLEPSQDESEFEVPKIVKYKAVLTQKYSWNHQTV